MLVGEGEVGKTSLLRALRGEEFVENRPTTHGIEAKGTAEAGRRYGSRIPSGGRSVSLAAPCNYSGRVRKLILTHVHKY